MLRWPRRGRGRAHAWFLAAKLFVIGIEEPPLRQRFTADYDAYATGPALDSHASPPRMTRSRRLAGAGGAVVLVILAAGAWHAGRIAAIGVAYKAKMVCSGVFVARQDVNVVLADLEADDLAPLRHITASMDAAGSVTASLFGLLKRRAVYREELGCALELDGLVPSVQPASRPAGAPPAAVGLVVSATGSAAHAALTAAIDRAFSEPNGERLRRTHAVVVMQHDRIVGERYATGLGPGTPLIGWSMTKSVVNALAGILVGQGRLTLDGPVPIPAWHAPGDPRGAITLDALLRMSSGLEFDEDMSNPRADVMRMLLDTGDAATYASNKESIAPPGTRWQYSSGTTNVIAGAMRTVFADDAEYLTFPRRALFERIGMSGAVLETDAAGTFVGSSYMYATARDWARFGLLYLHDGVWNGERILPEGWVKYTTTPAPADPSKRYGAHFWLQVPEEYAGTDGRLPAGTFHAAGHEAQFVTIVPSRDLVIVRLGHTRYAEAWDQAGFVRDVLAALDRP